MESRSWDSLNMLFLLNDRIVDVPVPEMHLQRRWRTIGCGDPCRLRAQDAIEFAQSRIALFFGREDEISELELRDLAALIIAKTGANCLMLKPTASGQFEPRLRHVPHMVLETYERGAANDRGRRSIGRIQANA